MYPIENKYKEEEKIYNALLPDLEDLKLGFSKTEVLFNPLHRVGGDFYWCHHYSYLSVFAVGDCTGHGLPGAMIAMSVLSTIAEYFNSLPPRSVNTALSELSKTLERLRLRFQFIDAELGFLFLDRRTNHVQYSGTGIKLIYKGQHECLIFSSKKTDIINFEQPIFSRRVQKSDQLILFTDGLTDQFDFRNNKRLGCKGLFTIIDSLPKGFSMSQFRRAFDGYRRNTPPIDDQTMVLFTA